MVFKKPCVNTGKFYYKWYYHNKFYREAHYGRLCVYDYLITSNKKYLAWENFIVAYNGKVMAYNPFSPAAAKRKLIDSINECYGLKLNPGDYTREQLWGYIQSLQ